MGNQIDLRALSEIHSAAMSLAVTYQNLEDGPFSDTIQGAIQWKDIASCVGTFLESVKSELLSQSKAFVPELAETCSQVLSCQGKLLRPTVFALTASSIGKLDKKCVTVAAVIEMIHLASLIHDDVIDGADTRRKQPTLAHLCGNKAAILLGDCILSQAAYLASSLGNEQVTQKILSSARSICIGETLQSLHTREIRTREQYFKVISLKTGELFALASELGALMAGASPDLCGQTRQYGMALGTAYQLYDDCVDIFSSEKISGKSQGIDLSIGKQTLPILLLLEKTDASDQKQVLSILENWTPERTSELLPFLKRYSILSSCISIEENILSEASQAISELPPSESRLCLERLIRFISQQINNLLLNKKI